MLTRATDLKRPGSGAESLLSVLCRDGQLVVVGNGQRELGFPNCCFGEMIARLIESGELTPTEGLLPIVSANASNALI